MSEREHAMELTLTAFEREQIDKARGEVPRARWIRDAAIERASAGNAGGPSVLDWAQGEIARLHRVVAMFRAREAAATERDRAEQLSLDAWADETQKRLAR